MTCDPRGGGGKNRIRIQWRKRCRGRGNVPSRLMVWLLRALHFANGRRTLRRTDFAAGHAPGRMRRMVGVGQGDGHFPLWNQNCGKSAHAQPRAGFGCSGLYEPVGCGERCWNCYQRGLPPNGNRFYTTLGFSANRLMRARDRRVLHGYWNNWPGKWRDAGRVAEGGTHRLKLGIEWAIFTAAPTLLAIGSVRLKSVPVRPFCAMKKHSSRSVGASGRYRTHVAVWR